MHTVLTIEQRGEHVFSTVVDVYDPKGRLIETLNSNADIEIHSGSMVRLGSKTISTYDSKGRLVKELSFEPSGEPTGYEVYLYDSQNRLIGTTIYDPTNKETGKRTYTYFPQQHQVLATWNFYYQGRIPPPMKNLLAYNEKGQWTQRTEFDSNGNPDDVITFDYDSDGNFIRTTTRGKYGFSFSYKFDRYRNWIEQQRTYNQPGQPPDPESMRKYRVITYYSDAEKNRRP
ncbi:MAG: hypothetical protein QOE77_1958 [Blastocatellia bacterium]|nr:hypothetical protein [Blastocatellia bacterium]